MENVEKNVKLKSNWIPSLASFLIDSDRDFFPLTFWYQKWSTKNPVLDLMNESKFTRGAPTTS